MDLFFLLPKDGSQKAPTTVLCSIINQLDTARRFMLNYLLHNINTEAQITEMMQSTQSPIATIPGIDLRMGAMILAEVGDFSNFDSPNKILAYAGLSPSTYESGNLSLARMYSHMEKRGSHYLRDMFPL